MNDSRKHLREFYEKVVVPNCEEFEREFGDIRASFNAVHAVDALAAHLYHAALSLGHPDAKVAQGDGDFREALATRSPYFRMLRDIANAQKHVKLDRGKPTVEGVAQIEPRSLGWDEGRWDEGRWGSPEQVTARTMGDEIRPVDAIVTKALEFLKSEISRMGLTVN